MEPRTREEIIEDISLYEIKDRFHILLLEILVDTRDELHDIRVQLDKFLKVYRRNM